MYNCELFCLLVLNFRGINWYHLYVSIHKHWRNVHPCSDTVIKKFYAWSNFLWQVYSLVIQSQWKFRFTVTPFLCTNCYRVVSTWASYQIRKIASCACAGNAGNVFPAADFQGNRLVSYPDMHHGTCRLPESLTYGGGENVPGIPGACANRNFAYLARGPWFQVMTYCQTAPRYHLNHCWFVIRRSPKIKNTVNALENNQYNAFKNCAFKIQPTTQELNKMNQCITHTVRWRFDGERKI